MLRLIRKRSFFNCLSSSYISSSFFISKRFKKKNTKKDIETIDPINYIRNMGIIAHVDAGKTTTAERMLYLAGEISYMGDVDDGNTVMDFLEMERERGITIQSAAITFNWDDYRINMIDTPGHVDFQGEVERSVRVLDGAIAIIDAVSGVQAQTHTIWKQVDRYSVPRIVYFNKMDQEDASIDNGIESMEKRLGVKNLLPIQIPLGSGSTFTGMIDLVDGKTLIYSKTNIHPSIEDIDETNTYFEQYKKGRENLLTKLADYDSSIIESYLEDGYNVSSSIIRDTIRKLTHSIQIIPVFCGSSFKNKGIQPLLDAIINYLPSPLDRPPIIAKDYILNSRMELETTSIIKPNINEPLSALAFKVVHDKKRGMIVYIRVYRGSFHCGVKLHSVNRNTGERALTLMRIGAETLTLINSIQAGDICAIVGMKNMHTGDTLIADKLLKKNRDKPVPLLPGVEIPPPVFTCAIEANDEGKEAHLISSLKMLCKEDPSFSYFFDKNTGQLLISGMGELHLEIIKDRLFNHYNVKAWIGKMRVAYRTTIHQVIEKKYEYTYELTGIKQSAYMWIRIEPLSQELEYKQLVENRILFLIPSVILDDIGSEKTDQVLDAIKEGVENVFRSGPYLGLPVHGVRATIRDIEYYDNSTPSAFRSCTSKMLRDMLKQAEISILQPYMKLEISAPSDHFGKIVTDISNVRRGNITYIGDGIGRNEKIIYAEVPLKRVIGYSTIIRSLTQGTASYSMEFLHYGPVSDTEAETLENEYKGIRK